MWESPSRCVPLARSSATRCSHAVVVTMVPSFAAPGLAGLVMRALSGASEGVPMGDPSDRSLRIVMVFVFGLAGRDVLTNQRSDPGWTSRGCPEVGTGPSARNISTRKTLLVKLILIP